MADRTQRTDRGADVLIMMLTRNDWWDDSIARKEFAEIMRQPALIKAMEVLRDCQIRKSATVIVQSTHPEFEVCRKEAHNGGYMQCLMDLQNLAGPAPEKRESPVQPEPWGHIRNQILQLLQPQ